MNWLTIDNLIKSALIEDIPDQDITTNSIVTAEARVSVDLIAKEDGIICGLPVFERVFIHLGDVQIKFFFNDGEEIKAGDIIAKIKGSALSILSGERTALNFLQRMSGIATITHRFVEKIEGTETKLLDTRKTTPNNRLLEKYAVKMGGGSNHRMNLSDGVMIKDNHIKAAGGIKEAITLVKNNVSFVRKIEVETETIEEVKEALEAGADIIMLDNMDTETMTEAVKLINGQALTEASGNMTLDRIADVAECNVDFISTGSLTHSYQSLDLSMKNLKNL